MSAPDADSLTEGQREALEAVCSIARASDGALTVDLDYQELAGYYLVVRVYLSSASLPSSAQGIKLEDWEPIDILIPKNFPYTPPIAWPAVTISRTCRIKPRAPAFASGWRTATGTGRRECRDSCGRSSTPIST